MLHTGLHLILISSVRYHVGICRQFGGKRSCLVVLRSCSDSSSHRLPLSLYTYPVNWVNDVGWLETMEDNSITHYSQNFLVIQNCKEEGRTALLGHCASLHAQLIDYVA